MATYSTEGIALLVHKYKGTGRVVSFYTRDRGRVDAVAQGIGKPGSKLAAAVELFTLSRLMLAEGRDLDRVAQADVVESHYSLRADMARLACASYIAELTVKSSEPTHPLMGLFEHLAEAYGALCTAEDPEVVLWWYMMRLFASHGVTPELSCCCRCGATLGRQTCYLPAEAGLACSICTPPSNQMPLSAEGCSVLQGLARMPATRLDRLSMSPQARVQVRHLLHTHADHQFGIQTRSRKFLHQMLAASQAAAEPPDPPTRQDDRSRL